MAYITIDDVRRASGADSDIISDADITSVITLVESEVERYLNAKFVPTEDIEFVDGNSEQTIAVGHTPLLSI